MDYSEARNNTSIGNIATYTQIYTAPYSGDGNLKLKYRFNQKYLERFPCLWVILFILNCGPGSSVGIATELRAGRSGDRIPVGRVLPPVQTCPGAHPASCTKDTGSFPGVKYGRGVLLTTHPLLVPWSWKSRAIPLPTLWTTTRSVKETLYLFVLNQIGIARTPRDCLRLSFSYYFADFYPDTCKLYGSYNCPSPKRLVTFVLEYQI